MLYENINGVRTLMSPEREKEYLAWKAEQSQTPPTPTPEDRLTAIEQTQLEQDAALMELAQMLTGGAV